MSECEGEVCVHLFFFFFVFPSHFLLNGDVREPHVIPLSPLHCVSSFFFFACLCVLFVLMFPACYCYY